ncbi:MAG: TlyA family RNA methyltransferase [Arachnia sp.]
MALVARGLARSRTHAATLVREGKVSVDGLVVTKPSLPVTAGSAIHADTDRWVSRAAHKLLGALDDSGTLVGPRVLDAGASTGGFTQVCLERGAVRVFAVDVGHDQLVPELRDDPRVVVREGLNLRHLVLDDLDGQPVDLVVGDVSFISLTLVLGPLLSVLRPGGCALLLVKPQFEVGRELLGAGGVVRDPALQRAAVDTVVDTASALGWRCDWRAESALPGTAGNVEFFVRLTG